MNNSLCDSFFIVQPVTYSAQVTKQLTFCLVTEHLQYPVHFCFPLSQQKTELLLIFNQLRFPFSSIHLLASCILFHCFRHSFATNQLTEGTDLYIISKMMGHTDIRTTQIYTKVVDPKKEQAADAIKLDLKSDVI